MPTVLRIKGARPFTRGAGDESPIKVYLDRLVKLIPAEVVGLYLAGKSVIQAVYAKDTAAAEGADRYALLTEQAPYWIGWTLFCLAALIWVRAWATSSPKDGVAPEWGAVSIAALSFLIWVYNFGDVFALAPDLWVPLLAALLVIAWTFVVPLIYRDAEPDPPVGRARRGGRGAAGAVFTEADAERVVLDAADHYINPRPGLTATVKTHFATAENVRDLVSRIQDLIDARGWGKVDLASGSAAEMTDLGAKAYVDLARWVHLKVVARRSQ